MHKICTLLGCCVWLAACHQPVASSQQQAELQQTTAIHAVLLDQPDLFHQETNLKIDQQFNRAENPSDAQINVEQTQQDDAVKVIRTEYQLKRDQQVWKIVSKKQSYRCTRGEQSETFQFKLCP